MDEPPISLPSSAYVMAVISGVFVFCGATFAIGIGTVMVIHGLLGLPEWSLIIVGPLVVVTSVVLGYLSAWETLLQARKKTSWHGRRKFPKSLAMAAAKTIPRMPRTVRSAAAKPWC